MHDEPEAAAVAVRADLEHRGFRLNTDGGQLWVSPADQLTDADRESIRAARDRLFELVAGDPEPWEPIPCEECGAAAIRNGTRLCRTCWDAWQRTPRAPRVPPDWTADPDGGRRAAR